MKEGINKVSDFFALAKKLQSTPNDLVLKNKLVARLPEMKLLAQRDPMVLYRLAVIYPPNSPEYKNAIRQSANRGCTNAMLDYSRMLVKSHKLEDLKTAAHFIKQINASEDTYIKSLSKSFLAEQPELSKLMLSCAKNNSYGFFDGKLLAARSEEEQSYSAVVPR